MNGISGFSHGFSTQRIGRVLAFVLPALCAVTTPAVATAGVVVHSPGEILDRYTYESGGRQFFRDADGTLWEFITDIEDPAIANKGQGRFFAADEMEIRSALDAISFPIEACDVEVFILPFPRRGLLKSSASGRAIYISPGVTRYAAAQIHSLIAHEMGHIVHNALMGDEQAWDRYRFVRSIDDASVFHDGAAHRDRPHEIFAEDFRFLFGGDLANYSHSIENPALPLPTDVPGLRRFFLGLDGSGPNVGHDLPLRGRLATFPNPTFGAVTVSFAGNAGVGGHPVDLRVYDVRGRLLEEQTDADPTTLRWEGRGPDGSPAPAGIYFVEVRRDAQRWVGKIIVSR